MKITPEIKFHECDRTAWVEEYIHERLEKLDRYAGGEITWASVTVAGEQLSKTKGNVYSVKVEVHLPPAFVLVATKDRTVHDLQDELRPLIKQACEAVEKQLQEAMAKRRGEVSRRTGGGDEAAAAPEL